jgi:hypothetical protein
VPALASVTTDCVGQLGYLTKRLEEPLAEELSTRRAAYRAVAGGLELIHLAEGAAAGVGSSDYRIVHLLYLSLACHFLGKVCR